MPAGARRRPRQPGDHARRHRARGRPQSHRDAASGLGAARGADGPDERRGLPAGRAGADGHRESGAREKRDADGAAGCRDRHRRAGRGGAGAAVPDRTADRHRHRAGLRRRQQPAGIFPAHARRAGRGGGRADGDGRGGRAAARAHARHAAGAAGHAAGCGRAGAGNGTSGRLRLRSGAAPRALACRDPDVFVVKTRNIIM